MDRRKAFRPRAIILPLLFFFFASLPAVAAESSPGKLPSRYENTNVILISLQCLRPDHLGTYGYKKKTSANIDRLATESVLFENAIAQANLTPVAQMSVMTSQYPRINGMISFEVAKDMVSQTSLPRILKIYGYDTAAVVSSPEFFLRYDADSKTMINPGDVFSRSFDYFARTRKGPGGKSVRKLPTESFRWIRENKNKKFFLWIASGLAHLPYSISVPQPYKTMYDPVGYVPFWKKVTGAMGAGNDDDSPSYDVVSRIFHNKYFWDFSPVHELGPADVEYINSRYDAGVFYTDLFVGELMKLLKSLGLSGKTLVVLHSIHGEDLGGEGRFFHFDVTDGVVKNALMFRFPKGEFAGKRVVPQVQGIDVMPTILSYLGIPVPHEAEGGSMLPLLRGEEKNGPDGQFAYIDRMPWWEYTLSKWYLEFKVNHGAHFSAGEKKKLQGYLALLRAEFDKLDYPPGDIAIRSNKWKLIVRKNRDLMEKISWEGFITGEKPHIDQVVLYDLVNDPGESKNVAESNPEVVADLRKKLLAWDGKMEKNKALYRKNEKRLLIPYP